MNDLERDLKELFDRKLTELRVPPAAPPQVMRRTHRRQARTVVVGAVVAVALAGGSLVGVRGLLERSTGIPGGEDETVSRTVSGVTITYPEAWHFEVFEPPAGNDREVQSNVPLFAVASFVPPASVISMTGEDLCKSDGVVLAVSAGTLIVEGTDGLQGPLGGPPDPWPVTLGPAPLEEAGACSVLQAAWTAAGGSYQAAALIGPDAGSGDMDLLVAAFEGMTFAPAEPFPPDDSPTGPISPVPSPAPSQVLASGVAAGEAWSFQARSDDELGIVLEVVAGDDAAGIASPSPTMARPAELTTRTFGTGDRAETVVFGAVVAGAERVVTETGDKGLIVPLDPSFGAGFDAFVVQTGRGSGRVQVEVGAVTTLVEFGSEPPEPVSPEHGGMYWAVYLGVGEAGPKAIEWAVDWARRLGVEAGSGELACDQGAAEALGVPADWHGVGVYFDTREDAVNFYLDSGLADHEVEAPIARVTTYCLD